MASVYTNITQNKRKTYLIMLLFILIISFIGWFIGEYYYYGSSYAILGFAFLFSGFTSLLSYFHSDKLVLLMSRAKKADKTEYKQLYNLVENMCIASGMQINPKIYLINDTAPNAFATGRNPKNSIICFTTGILQKLDKRELEGVIAHELSHIQNYDILLMSIVSILVGTITLFADFFTRGVFYGGGRKKRSSGSSSNASGIVLLIGIILVVLSPVIATLIKLAVSRKREYLADASAVMKTRNPRGLIDALSKISSDNEALEVANGATAHLYISNPLKNDKGEGFMAKLFNTHPPVAERIKRLQNM